ncbi:SDR family NAD(P)-dependent oxidoreductase [Streptomyces cinerochromogenes]|uniref:SDR family NAD(P)-dependent oxidoreductase n=1 Tax=Streptomyces cinerochromogenes TaxID=66422 RepID=UPI0036C3DA3C
MHRCRQHPQGRAHRGVLRDEGLDADGAGADVHSGESAQALVNTVAEVSCPLDALVHNAGRGGGGRTADRPDDFEYDVVDTNLKGALPDDPYVLGNGQLPGTAVCDHRTSPTAVP